MKPKKILPELSVHDDSDNGCPLCARNEAITQTRKNAKELLLEIRTIQNVIDDAFYPEAHYHPELKKLGLTEKELVPIRDIVVHAITEYIKGVL